MIPDVLPTGERRHPGVAVTLEKAARCAEGNDGDGEHGKTFKRCGCRNSRGQRLEQNCPHLPERGHGSWYFHCSAPNLFGRSERIRRGGFPSRTAARAAREECLADSAARRSGDGWTLERWLWHWLGTRTRIRPTTRLHYTRDAELVLIPYLGHYRLADLDGPPRRSAR